MSNATAHRFGAAAALATAHLYYESKEETPTAAPFASAAFGYAAGTLPDILEPATSPNHRQFFHSIAVVGMLGWGLWRLWEWQPEDDAQKLLKWLGLCAGGAYLVHLVMDATTPRGLPVV